MKSIRFFVLLLAMHLTKGPVIAQLTIPQLQAGVTIDSAFGMFAYNFLGYCDTLPTYQVILQLDQNLIPLATGVEIVCAVNSVSPVDTVYTLEAGIVHIGDTFTFPSAANNHYTFYSPSDGNLLLSLVVKGTPAVPFESYPCELFIICTLADCGNTCLITAAPSSCSVSDFSGINVNNENGEGSTMVVFHNGILEIFIDRQYHHGGTFSLFNSEGKAMAEFELEYGKKHFSNPLSRISSGIYFWKINYRDGNYQSGKLPVPRDK